MCVCVCACVCVCVCAHMSVTDQTLYSEITDSPSKLSAGHEEYYENQRLCCLTSAQISIFNSFSQIVKKDHISFLKVCLK